MIAEGRNFMLTAPWMVIFPGLAIVVLSLCVSLVGDAPRTSCDGSMACKRRFKVEDLTVMFARTGRSACGGLSFTYRHRGRRSVSSGKADRARVWPGAPSSG